MSLRGLPPCSGRGEQGWWPVAGSRDWTGVVAAEGTNGPPPIAVFLEVRDDRKMQSKLAHRDLPRLGWSSDSQSLQRHASGVWSLSQEQPRKSNPVSKGDVCIPVCWVAGDRAQPHSQPFQAG